MWGVTFLLMGSYCRSTFLRISNKRIPSVTHESKSKEQRSSSQQIPSTRGSFLPPLKMITLLEMKTYCIDARHLAKGTILIHHNKTMHAQKKRTSSLSSTQARPTNMGPTIKKKKSARVQNNIEYTNTKKTSSVSHNHNYQTQKKGSKT